MEGNNNGILYLTSYNNKFNEKKQINTNNTKNQIKTKNNQININNKKVSPKKLILNKKNNNDLKLGTDIKHISPEHINNYIFPENIKKIINAKQNLPQNIWIINNFLNSKDNINNIANEDVKVANTHYNYYKKNNRNSYKINILDSNDNITNLRNNKSKDSHIDVKKYLRTDYNIYKKGNNYNNNNIYNRNNLKNNNIYNFTNDNSNITQTIELSKNNNYIKTEENIEKSDININNLMNREKFKEEDQLINKINTDILIKNCQKLLANKKKDKNNKICKTSRNSNDINLDKIDEPKIEKENDLLQMDTIRIPKGIKNNTTKNSIINIKIDQNKKREDLFNKYTNAKALSKLKGDYTFESLLGANLDTIQNLNYDNYYNSLIDDFVLNDKMNNINYNNINNNNINIEDNNSTYLDILSALKENNYIKITKKPVINNEVDNIQKNKIDKNQIMLSENIDTNIDEQTDNNTKGKIKKIKLKLGRISNQNKINDNNDIRNYNNYYTNNNTKKNNQIISNESQKKVNSRNRINNNIIYQSNINNINLKSGGRNTPYRKKTPINRSVDSNNRHINIKTNIKTISQISPRYNIKIKKNHSNNNINNNIIVYLKKTKEIKSSISCSNIFKNKNNVNK